MSQMKPIESSNDFVIKFANVNGSGSASANELFARAIMRMGVPVAPRNIFPSNIQGMPTWYELRVSGAGWLGRRGGCELMVAMNPQTWDRDIAEIAPRGRTGHRRDVGRRKERTAQYIPAARADLQRGPVHHRLHHSWT